MASHKYIRINKQQTARGLGRDNLKLVDLLTYVAAIIEPVLVVPQIYRIFHEGNADGVSLATWIGFQVMTTIWLWYAIIHRQKAIFISSVLFWVVQLGVILGGVIYGAKW